MTLRFNSAKNKLWNDHSELLADPNIHSIIGKPRGKAQTEDPAQRFTRLVEEAMSRGMSYTEAVRFIDSIDPTLRQRSNELATVRREIEQSEKQRAKAAWRAEASRRFKERRGGK